MDGRKAMLAGAPPEAFRVRPVGPRFELPKEFAVRFGEMPSGDSMLSPDKIEVRTDGLEFNVALIYARPVGNALAVRASFLNQLPSSNNSSFVMTDETGNILASKILSRKDESVGLLLPAAAMETKTESPVPAASLISAPSRNPEATVQGVSRSGPSNVAEK
jgi:hypothetical protein